jgi:arginine deiminase
VGEHLMPPLPNTLYTRDTACRLYGGLTLSPLYWPALHNETLLMKAISTFHPDYPDSTVWWGDPEHGWGQATLEGGGVMPVGAGVVHLDTVFTFADRDLVTVYPKLVDSIHAFSLRPTDNAPGIDVPDHGSRRFTDAPGLPELRCRDPVEY